MHRTEPQATPAQLGHLRRHRIAFSLPLSRREASRLIDQWILSWRDRAATPRQERFLRQLGSWQRDLSVGEASNLIDRALERRSSPPGGQDSRGSEVRFLSPSEATGGPDPSTTT